jgi:hypothetical protein
MLPASLLVVLPVTLPVVLPAMLPVPLLAVLPVSCRQAAGKPAGEETKGTTLHTL